MWQEQGKAGGGGGGGGWGGWGGGESKLQALVYDSRKAMLGVCVCVCWGGGGGGAGGRCLDQTLNYNRQSPGDGRGERKGGRRVGGGLGVGWVGGDA